MSDTVTLTLTTDAAHRVARLLLNRANETARAAQHAAIHDNTTRFEILRDIAREAHADYMAFDITAQKVQS